MFVRVVAQLPAKVTRMSGSELPQIFAAGDAPRSTISDALARGDIRRLARRLYTRNLVDPPEVVVRRHLYEVVAALYPGAVIVDRSARLGARPTDDGSLFIAHARRSEAELPGLVIRPRRGCGPVEGDLPLPAGLHMSSVPRALLENAALTRSRGARASRTLTRPELEEWLDSLLSQRGEDGLRTLRENSRELAPTLGLEQELETLDPLIGAVLGTRSDLRAASPVLRARQKGRPFDQGRLALFEVLFEALDRLSPDARVVLDADSFHLGFLPFFEAYFSNFIEGTEFEINEAKGIVFDGVVPPTRPADAHDIRGTYQVVSDPTEMARTPSDADEFLSLLRSRHAVMLAGRPEVSPGQFKQDVNRVGPVEFVAPELVEGTLREGFSVYRRLAYPFARAVFQMFLVAEAHPFNDGNGRIARIMMNAELAAAQQQRIIIPQVYRNNYLMSLRALTVNQRPDALVRTLDFAQRYTAAIDFTSFDGACSLLDETHAFNDPAEADAAGIRLVLPDRSEPSINWHIVAGPRQYTQTPEASDIDVGWAWDIARDGEQRTVRVEVAGGRLNMPSLPDDSRQAIETNGRSAITLFLTDPPERLLVSSDGVFPRRLDGAPVDS